MKAVFNSLGSQYSWSFLTKALSLFGGTDSGAPEELSKQLEARFGGSAFLFYKGRDAIEFALRSLAVTGTDRVMVQALACHAIEEAVLRAGAKPLYVDVAENNVNLNLETVKATFAQAEHPEQIRALLVQHTLGVPVQMAPIKKWCVSKKIVLIEDLAQSYGGRDQDDTELGSLADIVICSFGRDKVVDALSGGACVLKQEAHVKKGRAWYEQLRSYPSQLLVAKDLLYPLLTWGIRRLHGGFFAPALFYLGKAFGILSSPTLSSTVSPTRMPAAYAQLALEALAKLEAQLYHRRQIAHAYLQALPESKTYTLMVDDVLVQAGAILRFPLLVAKPDLLAREVAHDRIFISDRWYRAPVDSGSLGLASLYEPGSCPHAEEVAKHVLNVPTHIAVNKDDVSRIVSACVQRM